MHKRKLPSRARKGFAAVTAAGARKLVKALQAAERSLRSRRGVETRKRRAAERSERASKGWRTRAARANVKSVLQTMVRYKAEGRSEEDWQEVRPDWYASKQELYAAVDEDFDRYAGMLDDIADECDVDWAIAYGPEPE